MRWWSAIPLVVLWAGAALAGPDPAAGSPAASDPVAYRLSPVLADGQLTSLKVEIRFREGPSGRTRLAWIKTWAGDEALWRHARGLRIEGGDATPDGPGAWIVSAPPGTPITASYRIVSAYDHDPTDAESRQASPVIRPTWFYAVGEALFAEPEDHERAPATFEWVGAPRSLPGKRGFGFASDLEHLAGPHRKASRPGTVDDIIESIAIGGPDLRTIERRVDGAPLRVAVVGRYGFSDADFADKVFDVLKAERGFWGDRAEPYLVAMSPTVGDSRSLSISGTGRSDAFALWVDPAARPADLRWLLAHEYFHTWNPLRLGGMPDGATEPLSYWFSEGFTDYYAWKLMLASGQFGPADFAERWNDTLGAYAVSPFKAAPNTVVMKAFWSSGDVQRLPYARGAILAATLDAQARAHGSSLDAVMQAMRRAAAGKDAPKLYADQLFPVVYQQVTGLDARPLIQRHMIDGEPITLPDQALGPCFEVGTRQVAAFDRGWDLDATRAAGMTLAGVKPGGPAYAAGLRDGMKVLEVLSTKPGDATQPYVVKVRRPGEADEVISYLPAGSGTISRQTVTPIAGPGCPTPPPR